MPQVAISMKRCFSLPCCKMKQKKKITLLMLGLDNSGKTCTAKCLLKESRTGIAPTIGFSSVKPHHPKYDITIYDLGGGSRIRGIWKNYFAEAHGLIFVIDSSEPHRLEECRETLWELIKNPTISGKPILVLANKQDCNSAMDEIDICEALSLEKTVNENKCRTRVETCSALGHNGKVDEAIFEGFHWLVDTIGQDYVALSARIAQAVTLQKEVEEKERAERMERVRRLRAEREKFEKANTVDEEENFADPFRPIQDIKAEFERKSKAELCSRKNSIEEMVLEADRKAMVEPRLSAQQKVTKNGFIGDGSTAKKETGSNAVDIKVKKKKKRFGKQNKTAPLEFSSGSSSVLELPPIQPRANLGSTSNLILRPLSSPPPITPSGPWGLAEELEPVDTMKPDS